MPVLFSTVAFLGLIVTVAAGVLWAVGRLRHRGTRARAVCIVAALVTVISFVAFGVTHEPVEKIEEPPAVEDTTPATAPDASDTPDVNPEPSAPEPALASSEPTPAQTPSPQPSPTPEEPEPTTDPTPTPTPTPEQEPAEETDPVEQAKQDIEEAARQIVADNYTMTDVERVSVNEDYGTDADGDYILLVYLTWNVENSAKMTEKVLTMYSEDFAARVGEDLENVQEFTVFWTVPYHSETDTAAKYSYERRSGAGMYQTDSVINIE